MSQKLRNWSDPAFVRAEAAVPPPGPRRDPLPAYVIVGGAFVRYGLAALLAYFGALELTKAGAHATAPLVAHSPILSWLLRYLAADDATRLLGAVAVAAALLVAARAIAAWLCLIGSLVAIAIFVTTLSFLVTGPGMFAAVSDFPLPVPSATGAFLLKDVFLLAAAVWSFAEAARGLRRRP